MSAAFRTRNLPMIGAGWPAGQAEPSRVHADHPLSDGGDGE